MALSTIRARLKKAKKWSVLADGEIKRKTMTKEDRKAILLQEREMPAENDFSGVKNSAGDQLYKPFFDTGEMASKITYVIEE